MPELEKPPRALPRTFLGLAVLAIAISALAAGERGDDDGEERLRLRSQPRVLGPHAPRVGAWIDDLGFTDRQGRRGTLSQVAGPKGLVLVVRDPDCPLSQRYSPRTRRLEEEAAKLGFGLLLVNPFDGESAERDVMKYGFASRYVVDEDHDLLRALAARTTTEVFVLDAARTLVYRGMIDDQYGLGFVKNEPDNEYLATALAQLARGESVDVPATEAHGCLLDLEPAELTAALVEPDVTYQRQISRIVQNRCQRCHRPGAAAPFPLTSYAEVKRKAAMIRFTVEEGYMPPWFSVGETGPWANDSSLTPGEKRDLLAWLNGDMPEGDPREAPLPRTWPAGWTIGEPDLVVELEPMDVPAEGVLDYQYVYQQLDLPEDRWVKAVEILPGAPEVVHHILFWLEDPELYERWRNHDPTVAGQFEIIDHYFAMTVPGQDGKVYEPGFGRLLPAKSWLKVQLHYTTNGTATVDRTRIGFVFTDEPVHHEVGSNIVANFKFEIPPGATNHPITGEFHVPIDGTLLSLLPHAHLRSKAFQVELIRPDGSDELLLDIPRYDFNWQLDYEFQEPLDIPKGSILRATGWYDNSAENPYNPDPTKTVRFGRQTWQEMMVIFFQWTPRR